MDGEKWTAHVEHLDTEFVMRWMALVLSDTTRMDDATVAQAFRQMILHLQTHIDQIQKEASR